MVAVLEMVSRGEVEIGVLPLYNRFERGIYQAISAIQGVPRRGYIHAVEPMDIHHALVGFGAINDVRRIVSKDVVFSQTSNWLRSHLPKVERDGSADSTAIAIQAVAESKDKTLAAIGTTKAAAMCGVPIIQEGIENDLNMTFFAHLRVTPPALDGLDHALIGGIIGRSTGGVRHALWNCVGDFGCRISDVLTVCQSGSPTIHVFQISSASAFVNHRGDLENSVQSMVENFNGFSYLGGYGGLSIAARLMEKIVSVSKTS